MILIHTHILRCYKPQSLFCSCCLDSCFPSYACAVEQSSRLFLHFVSIILSPYHAFTFVSYADLMNNLYFIIQITSENIEILSNTEHKRKPCKTVFGVSYHNHCKPSINVVLGFFCPVPPAACISRLWETDSSRTYRRLLEWSNITSSWEILLSAVTALVSSKFFICSCIFQKTEVKLTDTEFTFSEVRSQNGAWGSLLAPRPPAAVPVVFLTVHKLAAGSGGRQTWWVLQKTVSSRPQFGYCWFSHIIQWTVK